LTAAERALAIKESIDMATAALRVETNRIEDATDRLLTRVEREMGLTPAELAGALGVSLRTVSRWRAGETLPQRAARVRLTEVAELNHRLHETFEDEAVPVWLRAPNRYLGNVSPAEMLRLGRLDRVEAALEVVDSGIFL
jgi:DNA-binding transcriptional regulator YiaG